MAEYTCCSSVAFERPNENTVTLHYNTHSLTRYMCIPVACRSTKLCTLSVCARHLTHPLAHTRAALAHPLDPNDGPAGTLVPQGLSLALDADVVTLSHDVLAAVAGAGAEGATALGAAVCCNAASSVLACASSWDARVEGQVTAPVLASLLRLLQRCVLLDAFVPTAPPIQPKGGYVVV